MFQIRISGYLVASFDSRDAALVKFGAMRDGGFDVQFVENGEATDVSEFALIAALIRVSNNAVRAGSRHRV